MIYDYILIRYGEIALKGKNRYRFEDQLMQNIRKNLYDFKRAKVKKTFGRIYIQLNEEPTDIIMERLKKVFGIISFSPVKKSELDLKEMQKTALQMIQQMNPAPKTFKVETKRPYKMFPMQSPEISYEVGAHILRNTDQLTVNVHHPDTTVHVEVREEGVFIYSQVVEGIGGMPGESGGKGIALLSGGIDSPVASWFAMKRGLTVEGVHFHTYPVTTAESIQKVIDLAKVLTQYSGQFQLHIIPFLEIQKEIKSFTPDSYKITVMRRMFMRIAERLAEKRKALALITGESLGQVASQTLESMYAINHVTRIPVIRPLITMDKTEIIAVAREIDTFEPSIRPYEDMCSRFVPSNPATKPTLHVLEEAERKMNMDQLVENALEQMKSILLTPRSNVNADELLHSENYINLS